jgi:hypothetical protein
VSSGKVDIGAFRTYPEKYVPPDSEPSEYQSIPLNKIEDFGVHANQYYSLEVSHFKSSLDTKVLDLLWNKYWVATLSQSPLIIVGPITTRVNFRTPIFQTDKSSTWQIKFKKPRHRITLRPLRLQNSMGWL